MNDLKPGTYRVTGPAVFTSEDGADAWSRVCHGDVVIVASGRVDSDGDVFVSREGSELFSIPIRATSLTSMDAEAPPSAILERLDALTARVVDLEGRAKASAPMPPHAESSPMVLGTDHDSIRVGYHQRCVVVLTCSESGSSVMVQLDEAGRRQLAAALLAGLA